MQRLVLVVFVMIQSLSGFAISQETTQREPTKEELQREIRILQRELARSQKLVERAQAAGFIPDEESVASVLEIINCLPEELALDPRKPWDLVQADQAKKVLEDFAIGKEFKAKLKVSSIKVKQNAHYVANSSLPKYYVTVTFENKVFPKSGMVFTQDVTPTTGYTFGGDEDIVEKAKKIRTGRAYEVSGLIRSFSLVRNSFSKKPEYGVTMTLASMELTPLK